MLHFHSSERKTAEHAPNTVNAGTAVSCHEGTTWRGKHEVSGKCCCNWGKKDIQKLSNHPHQSRYRPWQMKEQKRIRGRWRNRKEWALFRERDSWNETL